MAQKEFRSIKNWDEFTKLWKTNDKYEIALGLLYTGPQIYKKSKFEEKVKILLFYINTARLMDYRYHYPKQTLSYEIGWKAYRILVNRLLTKDWMKSWLNNSSSRYSASEIPILIGLLKEIVRFFAEEHGNLEPRFFDQEPYRSDVRELIKNLWLVLNSPSWNKFEIEAELTLGEKNELVSSSAKALVDANLFEFILENYIFEAIPALEEKIFHYLGYIEAPAELKAQLEDFRSKFFRKAIRSDRAKEYARVLLVLVRSFKNPKFVIETSKILIKPRS